MIHKMFKLYFLNQDLKDVISVSRGPRPPRKNPLPTYSILEKIVSSIAEKNTIVELIVNTCT